jgi:hypothetical protein
MPGWSSASPTSDVREIIPGMPTDFEDVFDVWRVECPGQPPEEWYTNIYRCGNSCPPRGYGVLHPSVMSWLEYLGTVGETYPSGDYPPEVTNEIVRLGSEAALADTRLNVLMELIAAVALASGEMTAAVAIIDAVVAREPVYRTAARDLRVQIRMSADDFVGAEEDLLWLMKNFGGHATWPTWACTLSSVYATLGRAQDALQFARQGCEAGGQCCDLAQAPPSDPAYPECSDGPGPTPT